MVKKMKKDKIKNDEKVEIKTNPMILMKGLFDNVDDAMKDLKEFKRIAFTLGYELEHFISEMENGNIAFNNNKHNTPEYMEYILSESINLLGELTNYEAVLSGFKFLMKITENTNFLTTNYIDFEGSWKLIEKINYSNRIK
jgi:hypothetical protein